MAQYGLYRLLLKSGAYRLLTPGRSRSAYFDDSSLSPEIGYTQTVPLPDRQALSDVLAQHTNELVADADEVVAGRFRPYGGASAPLALCPPPPLRHWSSLPSSQVGEQDIKDVWEPARLGWVFLLGRAYHLNQDEKYSRAFWEHLEEFLNANPPNLGVNWASAQEVGIRILAMAYAHSTFAASTHSSAARQQALLRAIAEHARRIPPTLIYARAQNNNHLLTEAAGLYTAGSLLAIPAAKTWRRLGKRWLKWAFQRQIDAQGEYSQHSMNYHRLMLHVALWVDWLAHNQKDELSQATQNKLAAATRWLLAQLDPVSGQAPNLGHNDGANILPLAQAHFRDYRPVAQAASRAFLQQDALPPGLWDELSLWLGQGSVSSTRPNFVQPASPGIYRLVGESNWATLRAAHYNDRPAHADQLHVELWRQGQNIATDAGTFRYNAAPPWENALAQTMVHNTLLINRQDQMQRAGKFLWLDWAQAQIGQSETDAITATHDGYRRLGVIHRRTLAHTGWDEWQIDDEIVPLQPNLPEYSLAVHWLLPDWNWTLEAGVLTLQGPHWPLQVRVWLVSSSAHGEQPPAAKMQLIRAGQAVYGNPQTAPVLGWVSPTYGLLQPALSLRVEWVLPPPVHICTRFSF